MKVSLNWLNDHVDLASLNTGELCDMLTFAGIEVEEIEERGGNLDHVVVAKVLSSEPHPNADKLSVCQVDDGSGANKQIVCGAKNYKVGDCVPLATPGAVMPGGFAIKNSKLRGVESQGMMCSGRELGLSDDHEGLLILPSDSVPGTPMAEMIDSDTIFDLEITPNRSDCLSHLGVARELAVLHRKPLKGRADYLDIETKTAASDAVRIENTGSCPFYSARIIRGIKVGPSPDWLQAKLAAIGLRPINNIVDITNFVLFEMGQPLHAFDLGKLDGGIIVRAAADNEVLRALDGEDYTLQPDDLVIADQSKALAIGGVMGGEDSGVVEGTTDILLESAWFLPGAIRRTSRRLDLSSDSSYRFERGVDPAQTLGASELATRLITEIAGGTPEDTIVSAGEVPEGIGEVAFDLARAEKLLGAKLPEAREILAGLGLRLQRESDGISHWKVPTYRPDLSRHVDLVEEIVRVIGMDRIPARANAVVSAPDKADRRYDQIYALKNLLAGLGVFEAQTMKLVAREVLEDDLTGLRTRGGAEAVAVKNPLSSDYSMLRPSLLPGLLASAALNSRMGADQVRAFETGTVFSKHPKNPRVLESTHLAIVMCGTRRERDWHGGHESSLDFHDLVGVIESALAVTGQPVAMRTVESDKLLVAAEIVCGKTVVGVAGRVHPARARELDWPDGVYVAELDLGKLLKNVGRPMRIEALPKYPPVSRDVAFESDAATPAGDFTRFFLDHVSSEKLLENVLLFDVFVDPTGEKLAADRRSLAYSLTYRSETGTLKANEVDEVHARVLKKLEGLPSVVIR